MNRARAKRRLIAWDRYYGRYPQAVIGNAVHTWWLRARRSRRTHAGIQAFRDGRAL